MAEAGAGDLLHNQKEDITNFLKTALRKGDTW